MTVTLNDGDFVEYDPDTDYILNLRLTAADPTVTVGFGLDPNESIPFVLTAPSDSSILAALTTGPNGTGTTLINFSTVPASPFELGAGEQEVFEIDGAFGGVQWWTLSLNGLPGDPATTGTDVFLGDLVSDPGAGFAGDGTISFVSDASGGLKTFNEQSDVGGQVPLPAGVWLMLVALGSFVALKRRRTA